MFEGLLSALLRNWALGAVVIVASTALLWLLWSAARRYHFHTWPKFPGYPLLVSGFILVLPAGCLWTLRPVPQPESAKTVVAVEVPLPTAADKSEFLTLLSKEAQAHGYHVDAATPEELENLSEVSPMTFSAEVWRGEDKESIASAMDFADHIGRVWVMFSKGENPQSAARFRQRLLPQFYARWPETRPLPIMPTGAIPNVDEMTRTPSGYVVKPSGAPQYSKPAS